MGFECGFEVVPRIENIGIEEYLYTMAFFDYDKNTWMKEHYSTFQEYFESNYSILDKVECKHPNRAWYMSGYEHVTPQNLGWWCSIGRRLDEDYVQGKLDRIDPFEKYEVYESWVGETLEILREDLKNDKLIPVTGVYSMHYNDDGDKVLKPCDGLLVEDENENQKLIEFEYDDIWIAPKYFDMDYHNAKEQFVEVLEKLQRLSFNDNIVIYYRSY